MGRHKGKHMDTRGERDTDKTDINSEIYTEVDTEMIGVKQESGKSKNSTSTQIL